MKDKLRDSIGWEKGKLVDREIPEEILALRKARCEKEILQILQDFETSSTDKSLAVYLEEKRKQKCLNREVKHQIYNNRRI